MTPDEWKTAEGILSYPYGRVSLRCDGYDVTLIVSVIGKLKLGIVVYVNGKADLSWLNKDCEERNKFLCQKEKPLYCSAAAKVEKKLAKLCKRPSRHDKKYTYWLPYWTNVTALRRHFCKHNTDIQLVRGDA